MATTINNTTTIHHVFGNVLKLAIPLTLRTITLEGGVVHAQDSDYYPSTHDLVVIEFGNGPLRYKFNATLRDGHIAVMEDKGTIPVGTYAITVLCRDENGDPRRFKQRCVLDVVDVTADAGIEAGIEFEGTEWYLDAAIYLAIVGENGVGIADITTHETDVSGEYNSVTFTLTNGESYTLFVRNGLSTEQTLPANIVIDEFYVHTDNNYTDSDMQNVQRIDSIANNSFGYVVFDPVSKYINFFAKGDTAQTRRLGYVDASPFLADANLNSVSVNNNGEMVFQFNQDSNKEPIRLPISLIFNKDNYYTKSQTDTMVSRLTPYEVTFTSSSGNISSNSNLSQLYTNYSSHKPIIGKFGESVGTLVYIKGGENPEAAFLFGDRYDSPYLLRNTGTQYWSKEDLVDDNATIEIDDNPTEDSANAVSSGGVFTALSNKVTGISVNNGTTQWPVDGIVNLTISESSGGYEPPVGGIPKTDLASGVQTSLDSADSAYQKPSGGIPSTDMTSAVQTSLGKADTAYQKPSGGIPASDLASGVIPDVSGFVTSSDVQTAIAGLVDSAPETLDTLNELAAALGDDKDFATTMSTALGNKVDKETGKGLSTNDYTDAEKTKLGGIETGAEVNVQADWNQTTTTADDYIKNKPTLATVATSGSYNDLTNKPTIPDVSGFATTTAMNTALAGKQDTLTFDTTPTANSTKPVTSGGVKTYVDGKATITGITTSQDGTFTIALSDGNSYTVNLNHVHPQYATQKTVVSNTDATVTLSADVIYNLGTVAGNKTINLPTTVDQAADYEFRLSYTSGTISGTAISGTTVANDATLTFTAGKTYQVIISGGILYFSETTVSA